MPPVNVPPGVEGIAGITQLPDDAWQPRWDRIIVPAEMKDRLLNYMLFSLRHRGRLDQVGLPVHGLVVLAGPPGTGKTTLAGGLADRAARELGGDPLLYVDVDPHTFPSQLLGESQRAVSRLFERTLPDIAGRGLPVVVLLDEVEALAVNRSRASLDTNPVDVHRSTEAVLSGIDRVAGAWPNVTFVATTNYIAGVDAAFLSRADLVEDVGVPGAAALEVVLADAIREVTGRDTPADGDLTALAAACADDGMDGRQARKLVLRAISASRSLADDPENLRAADLLALYRGERRSGGNERQ